MRVITILSHGTANSTNRSTSGGSELVISKLARLLAGQDGADWILNEGAGTKELRRQGIDSGGFMGAAAGEGVQANVDKSVDFVKRQLKRFSGGIGSSRGIAINLAGHSRGSITCYKIANALLNDADPAVRALPVNIFAIDPVPGNNTVLTHVAVLGISDIALTADPPPTTVDQGDVISLIYTVTNNGADDATTVRLGLVIPAGTSFVAATSSLGDCAEGGGEVLCSIGDLALAASAAIEIQLSADAAGELQFTANAAADQIDPDDANNSVTAMVTAIPNTDLRISGSAPSSTTVRQQFNVTVTVNNDGPQDATNVVATIAIPSLVDFISADGCVLNGSSLECAVGALAAGGSVAFTVRFGTDTTGTATVNASVVGDQTDPNTSNNSMTVRVSILNPPSSGGGCVYNPGGPADPTLPAMLLFALLMLGWRRRMMA